MKRLTPQQLARVRRRRQRVWQRKRDALAAVRAVDSQSPVGGVVDDGTTTDGGTL